MPGTVHPSINIRFKTEKGKGFKKREGRLGKIRIRGPGKEKRGDFSPLLSFNSLTSIS
ncbi:MAG: hypothetical protein PHE70_04985 [Tepidanaerobacteraceae bacterium]|nr:hypothetical protein [Tepidanaerobacteraceae bacterium]